MQEYHKSGMDEESESFSLDEFYMNKQKSKVTETKTKEDYCVWNKICSDESDVFDSDGFATRPERRIGASSVYIPSSDGRVVESGGVVDISDLWKFHIPTREWTELYKLYPKTESECWPHPCFDHTALSVSLSQPRFESFLKNHPELGQLTEKEPQNSLEISSIHSRFYNQMYMFGGQNDFEQFSASLYCFDFTFGKYIKINYECENNELMLGLSRHCMVSVNDRYLYIVGGMTNESKVLMDVWEYDTDTNVMKRVWRDINEESVLNPQPRSCHSCIYSKLNHSIYMFGGIRNSETFQDLWRFDLTLFRWFPIDKMKGFVPVERFRHISFIPNEESDYFFVYGGYNFKHSFLDNVYQFCFSTLEWTRLQNRNYTQGGEFQSRGSLLFVDYNEIPTARSGMSSIITKDGDLIIFGGKSFTGLNDMFICHLPGYSKIRGGQHYSDKMFRHTNDCFFVDLLIKTRD